LGRRVESVGPPFHHVSQLVGGRQPVFVGVEPSKHLVVAEMVMTKSRAIIIFGERTIFH
jgi:hypothetical protein